MPATAAPTRRTAAARLAAGRRTTAHPAAARLAAACLAAATLTAACRTAAARSGITRFAATRAAAFLATGRRAVRHLGAATDSFIRRPATRCTTTRRAARRFAVAPVSLAVAGVVGVAGPVPPATAYSFLGCRFAGTAPSVGYVLADVGGLAPAVRAAARGWNRRRGVPGRFRLLPAVLDGAGGIGGRPARLTVGRVDSVIDAWGWIGDPMSRPPECMGGRIDPYPDNETSVYLNEPALALLQPQQQVLVVQHELGHALGLGHVPGGCRGRPAVMVQGSAKWRCGWPGAAPWPDDRAGVRRIYADGRSSHAGGRDG